MSLTLCEGNVFILFSAFRKKDDFFLIRNERRAYIKKDEIFVVIKRLSHWCFMILNTGGEILEIYFENWRLVKVL